MANGIIIIDKPADWTSMDVCAKLRGILKERRIGHGGTLDPMATGVLPVFVGSATRAVEFAEKGDKEYIAGLRLGLVTNTQDTTGEVLSESYALEYGTDELQIHADAISADDVVLLVDDLVATGGTAVAQVKLVEKFGARLAGMGFLMELDFLHPREAIAEVTDVEVFSLVHVE